MTTGPIVLRRSLPSISKDFNFSIRTTPNRSSAFSIPRRSSGLARSRESVGGSILPIPACCGGRRSSSKACSSSGSVISSTISIWPSPKSVPLLSKRSKGIVSSCSDISFCNSLLDMTREPNQRKPLFNTEKL